MAAARHRRGRNRPEGRSIIQVKESTMLRGQTTLQAFRRSLVVAVASAALLFACAPAQPAQSPEEIRAQVAASVARTVAARNQMGTFVAQTVEAQQPAAPETALVVPTLTPILPTATTFVVIPPSSGGGGGGGGSSGGGSSATSQKYLCTLIA